MRALSPETQSPYASLGEAAGARPWQNAAMKTLFIACGLFAAGFVMIAVLPGTDLVTAGVRAILDDVAAVW